jgi:hypothetical protein
MITGSWPILMSGSYIPSAPVETEMEKQLRLYEEKRTLCEKLRKFKKFSLTSQQEPPILQK